MLLPEVYHAITGYPLSPGHYVSSMTYRNSLATLPWHGQLVNL